MLRLDANESPFNGPDNLYPDYTELTALKELWGQYEHIPSSYSYFCNGTEEGVDLCIRAFVKPYAESVAAVVPTRAVYQKRAAINRVGFQEFDLSADDYSLDTDRLIASIQDTTKIIFICSPNSPTGNRFDRSAIEQILKSFKGLLVVDESYIDYCLYQSNLSLLNVYDNLVLLRSFSHAWSSAAARLSVIVARPTVIRQIEAVGLAHPLNAFVLSYAKEMVLRRVEVHKWVRQTVEERTKVFLALKSLPLDLNVYPSDANFIFVNGPKVDELYTYLKAHDILVKSVAGGLRISIGLPRDNSILLAALRKIK